MNSWSPPQDPEYTSELSILSPVSPKPLHYSIPSNIPVLENQIDLAFNQTQAHMAEVGSQHQQPQGSQQLPPSSAAVPEPAPSQIEAQPSSAWGQDGGYHDDTQEDQADSEMNNAYTDHAPPSVAPVAAATAASEEAPPSQASHDHLSSPTQNPSDSVLPTSNVTTFGHDVPQSKLAQAQANVLTVELPPGVERNPGGIDYQTLLDNLSQANAPQAESITIPTTDSSSSNPTQPLPGPALSPTAGFSSLPSSLPPRPPPQDQPSIHPNYTHSRDIRDYHPHSHNPAVLPHPQQSATTFRPNAQLPTFPPAPGQTNVAGTTGLPPPPVASFQQAQPQMAAMAQSQSPASQAKQRQRELESQREIKQAAGEVLDDADAPWTPEIQRLYDNFLNEERRYVTEGNWEQFPYGSRLFVGMDVSLGYCEITPQLTTKGNLSSERVTKRDIFHVFHTYGALAQISIKQAYGFVQFLETGPCQRALQTEEGKTIRGKKIRTFLNLI